MNLSDYNFNLVTCEEAVAAEQGGGARGALAPPKNFVFSEKILIIKEKFRVFLEGKICNILFKKCVSGKFFSSPFLYMSGKIFWFMSEKKVAGGREKILITKKKI